MFRDIFTVTLDSKGRLSVPVKIRKKLEELEVQQLIITADIDENLLLYTLDEWEKAEAKLVKLSSINEYTRGIKRIFLGNSSELEIDSTGRLLIPPALRKRVGLSKKVMLVGMGNKFEIWAEDTWEKVTKRDAECLLNQGFDLSDELGKLSL